ncbi:bis(5 -nucleosyl)-tetraphosphatase [asymmetrical] [Brachionus plicatilis]|uniref:Bis(5'-nucleosyl)-tetraphosphatase [asymmetrical] n=1 Tax=Brachionus plicatilis TaxID=10195 RepID=A0A3M7SF38_BRAPC|nr:bis(5 -nucleosyl)-tetraphosphatase [asymmetrical] [Brachionus plicatilis]
MSNRLASGIILFRKVLGSIEYLLLQTSYGINHWTPPKGHLDDGEDFLTAAIRETREEAGLEFNEDYALLSNECTVESNYVIDDKIPKRVVYWIAEMKNADREIKLSDEHIKYGWFRLNDACDIVQYEEMKKVLIKADAFIINRIKH